jgi:hypothetical protein
LRITKRTAVAGAVAVAVAGAAAFGLISSSAGAATTEEPHTAAAVGGKDSVTGWHVKDGTLYGADLAPGLIPWFTNTYDNTVKSVSIVDGAVAEKDLAPAVKSKLISGLESDSPYPSATQLSDKPGNGANSTTKFVAGKPTVLQRAWVRCADGKTAIGGGYQRGDEGDAAIKGLQIVSSTPTQIDKDGKDAYVPITGDAVGSFVPNAWLVEGYNDGTTDLIVRPSVVCANIG